MALWWLGNAVLLLVVAPAVVVLLLALLRQVQRLNKLADETLEHGVQVAAALDGLPHLVETKSLTGEARSVIGRYRDAVLSLVGA